MRSYAISLCLLFILSSPLLIQSQTITSLNLAEETVVSQKSGETRYFTFKVSELKEGYDITINARTNLYWSDPYIYVSSATKYPNSTDTAQYYTRSTDHASITISAEDIIENQAYYIGAVCKTSQCSFNLTVDYAKDVFVKSTYDLVDIHFVTKTTLVTRFEVAENAEIERIIFAAEVENIDDLNDEVFMFVNAGNEVPYTDHHNAEALIAWRAGKAAEITKEDDFFCTGCNYTIVIEAPIGAKVALTKRLYGALINIQLDETRHDVVEAMRNNTYVLNLKTIANLSSEIITIDIKPYYGISALLCNLNTLPEDYASYRWEMTEYGMSRLSLTPKERLSASRVQDKLYITVVGISYGTYSITVKGHQRFHNKIKIGEFETGYALPNERINYHFQVTSNKTELIIVNLAQDGDGNADIFLKSCEDKETCHFIKPEIDSLANGTNPISEEYPYALFSNVEKGDQQIRFKVDPKDCPGEDGQIERTCLFGVVVSNSGEKTAHYTLVVEEPHRHKALSYNGPTRDHLLPGETKYFYYHVPNDQNVSTVSFQLTEINGYTILLASKTHKYPNDTNSDKVIYFGDKIVYTRDDYKHLNGTYHLAATAITSATFSITPIIEYTNGQGNVVKLSQGIPQKATLKANSSAAFSISTYYTDKNFDAFDIQLDNTDGKFTICVRNDGKQPALGFCTWQTNLTKLQIHPDDENFRLKADYAVVVFTRPDLTGEYQDTYSFSIYYATLMNFNELRTAIPQYSQISKGVISFYKFLIDPSSDTEVSISVQSSASTENIGIYLSSWAEGLTNLSSYNNSKISNGSVTIRMHDETLDEFCAMRKNNRTFCYCYVAIQTNSTNKVYPITLLRKDFSTLNLHESTQMDFGFPIMNHSIGFIYYPHQLLDISISARSFSRQLMMFASVFNTKDASSRKEWPFPDNTTYNYSSSIELSAKSNVDIFIPAEALSACSVNGYTSCVVLITMYSFKNQDSYSSTSGSVWKYSYDSCSILATQEITPLTTGMPVKSFVGDQVYKYFKLNVNKRSATLLASLTTLSDGFAYLMASYGEHARPTLEDNDFMSFTGKSDTLQISNEDIYPRGSMEGVWVIGVYGLVACEFSLTAVFEDHKILHIWDSVPQQMHLKAGEMTFFQYYNWRNETLKIILNRAAGTATIGINKMGFDGALLDHLPTKDNATISEKSKFSRNVISIPTDSENFCVYCVYVIGIFAETSVRFALTVTEQGGFIYLQPSMALRDNLPAGKHNSYQYFLWDTNLLDIDMVVYSGKPKLYVGHNPTVNESNYIWKFDSEPVNKVIRLKIDNAEYKGLYNLSSVFDGSKYWPSDSNRFYIRIYSDIESNYSITVSKSNSSVYIYDGVISTGFINPGEYNNYTYWSLYDLFGSGSFQPLKIAVTIYRDAFSRALRDATGRPKIKIQHSEDFENYTIVHPFRKDTVRTNHGPLAMRELIQIPNNFGIYSIQIINEEDNGHFNYSLVVNSNHPFALPLDTMFHSRLVVGGNDNYELHIDDPGVLVIEVHECFGKIGIVASTTPAIFEDDFIDQIEEDDGDDDGLKFAATAHHISFYKLKISDPGIIFVKIAALEGLIDEDVEPQEEALYKIRATHYPVGTILPYQNIVPGNDGNLHYKITGRNSYQIDFTPLRFYSKGWKNPDKELDIAYEYDLFFAKDDRVLGSVSRCDITPKEKGIFTDIDTKSWSSNFADAEPGSDNGTLVLNADLGDFDYGKDLYSALRVTMYNYDEDGQIVWSYPVLYNTLEVKSIDTVEDEASDSGIDIGDGTTEHEKKGILFVLLICAAILGLAICGFVVYFKKYKRVKARLQYEMQDVRNVIAAVESEEQLDREVEKSKKQAYNQLISEGELKL